MKRVHYHQEARDPLEFAVLKEHGDGTLDIGPAGGEPVVTRCKVTPDPVNGSATLVKESAAEKAAAPKPRGK